MKLDLKTLVENSDAVLVVEPIGDDLDAPRSAFRVIEDLKSLPGEPLQGRRIVVDPANLIGPVEDTYASPEIDRTQPYIIFVAIRRVDHAEHLCFTVEGAAETAARRDDVIRCTDLTA